MNLETTLVISHPASHKGLQVCPFYLNAHYFFIPPPLPHLGSVSSFLPCVKSIDSWPVRFSPTHHLNWQVDLFKMHIWAFHFLAENCSLAPHCLYNKVQSPWWSPQNINKRRLRPFILLKLRVFVPQMITQRKWKEKPHSGKKVSTMAIYYQGHLKINK